MIALKRRDLHHIGVFIELELEAAHVAAIALTSTGAQFAETNVGMTRRAMPRHRDWVTVSLDRMRD